MRCIVCGSNEARIIGKRSDFNSLDAYARFVPSLEPFDRNIVSCGRCGFAFIDPMYDDAEIATLYGDLYEQFAQAIGADNLWIDRRDLIPVWIDQFKSLGVQEWKAALNAKHDRKPRMLDVGCGYGRVMHLFDLMGFEVQGIDIDPHAAAYVSKMFGYRVERRSLSDASSLGQFDAVGLFHVIEHFTDLDRSMAQVVGLIAPGGCLIIETPWAEDHGRYEQRYCDIYHTAFFNHLSLLRRQNLAEHQGHLGMAGR